VPGELEHLSAIEPLAVRVGAARERLAANGSRAAEQLEALLTRAREGHDRARRSLLACCIAIAQADGAPWVDILAREAATRGLTHLGRMLGDGAPHRAIRRPGRMPDPHVAASTAAFCAGASMNTRARMPRLFPVDRLLAHPDPRVVRKLLRGPWLQLRDALVIVSRRPTTDAIVDEIVHSLRWIARIQVREALVANPFVRPRIALALLPTLLEPARRAISRGSVHPAVRQAADEGD
jgi:hypothetical protein